MTFDMQGWYGAISVDFYLSGVKQGEGPVFAISCRFKRTLDGAGTFQVDFPLTDKRVLDLAVVQREIRIFFNGRRVFIGIVKGVRKRETEGQRVLTISGVDSLWDLGRFTTNRGRTFNNVTVSTAVSTLAGLAGWTATASSNGSDIIFARFDGQNVLEAIKKIAEQKGLHFRRSGTNQLTIGAFGDVIDLLITSGAAPLAGENESLLLIDSIELLNESVDIVNWLEPIGNGKGESVITLADSTRTSPYTIQSTAGPRGTIYYLEDATSVSAYGTVERVLVFKQVTPLSTDSTDIVRASNALYDYAAEYLARHKDPLTTYRVTVRPSVNLDVTNLQPGNKIRLLYNGAVEKDNEVYTYISVNETFWIMAYDVNISGNGPVLTLDIATVDRFEETAEDIILDQLESVQIENKGVSVGTNHYLYQARDVVSASPDIDFVMPMPIGASVRNLTFVTLHIKTLPLFSDVPSSTDTDGSSTTGSGGGQNTGNVELNFATETPNPHFHTQPTHTHSVPNHSHGITAALSLASTYPGSLTIQVNGNTVASGVGGTGSSYDNSFEVDLSYFSPLEQVHEITVSAGSGEGRVIVTLEVDERLPELDKSLD